MSPTQGLPVYFPVGMVLHNQAVEHNVAVFRPFVCCTLAGKAKQRLVLRVTMLILCEHVNSCRIVDNLTEKVDECPLIRVVKYCLHTTGTAKIAIPSSNVSLFRGCLSTGL